MQLEVTLLIFLRLAEDVMLSLDPHLQQQRRRNIEQGLSENIESLFQFFISTLSHHVGLFKESVSFAELSFIFLLATPMYANVC